MKKKYFTSSHKKFARRKRFIFQNNQNLLYINTLFKTVTCWQSLKISFPSMNDTHTQQQKTLIGQFIIYYHCWLHILSQN